MSDSTLQAIDRNGVRGTLDLTVIPPQGSESKLVLVRFDDGRSVFVDGAAFEEREKNQFYFPGSFAALTTTERAENENVERVVIPILEEELKIARREIITGGVRIHKTVAERTETVDEPLLQEQVAFERVPINQFVDAPPAVRYEGDVMIVPLLEEVLVVEKRLVVREEIRISKRRETVHKPQQVVVRREEATIEQIKPEKEIKNAPDDEQGDAVI